MVVGAWVRKLRYGGWDHFWMLSYFSPLLFGSCLDLGPVQMVSAYVFTTYQWRWSFPVYRVSRNVTIERTDRLWDLWDRTIVYVG